MDETDLRERLANVAADLLSHRQFQPAVERLFARTAGEWQTVAECFAGSAELPRYAAEVFAGHADRFHVTHLPWPGPGAADEDALILFTHDQELWSTTAYFNRRVGLNTQPVGG